MISNVDLIAEDKNDTFFEEILLFNYVKKKNSQIRVFVEDGINIHDDSLTDFMIFVVHFRKYGIKC